MPGPLGASQFQTPGTNPADPIENLQKQIDGLRVDVNALKAGASPVAALSLSGVAPVPMPESEIGPSVERIVAACVAIGYEEERLRLFESDMHDALAAGVPEGAIAAHYEAMLAKSGSFAALYENGHGANLRLDESLWPLLLDGTGIGFRPWSATDEERKAIFGYTLAELEAAERPGEVIVNPAVYFATKGLQGWRPRANDPRGASSDDRLFGEPKP